MRYNEIASGIHDAKGSGHPDLFHEPADEIKSCTDFNEYLGYMENRPGEPLSDIYFFPHSTKEVCIHTVPNEVEDRSLYNTYQAMSRFAHIIHSRIKDKPLHSHTDRSQLTMECAESRMNHMISAMEHTLEPVSLREE